mmetsp:Transcript_30754/g.44952  ORF Transcript_30754/g.44952 Transcript_30754/m.44952 type:complete len:172 (+) Transcript_30754:155-670(+)
MILPKRLRKWVNNNVTQKNQLHHLYKRRRKQRKHEDEKENWKMLLMKIIHQKNTIRVKLDDVRQCIENNKEKFDFLVGITENLSESKASGYAAAMTRKLKRKSTIDSSNKAKVTANSGKKRKGEKKCNVLEEATGSIDEVNGGVELQSAINDAQMQNSFVEDIVEDSDEYD